MRSAQRHTPAQMTKAYNRTQAFAKIAMAPLDRLDARMVESISRTHKVPVADLQRQIDERKAREGVGG